MTGPGLHVRLLGSLTVLKDGVELPLPASRKVRALLAFLAVAPGSVTRSRLCELLWDVPNDPRGELRWSLSKLRSLLDERQRRRIEARGDAITLDLSGCFVDVAEITRTTPGGVETLDLEQLRTLDALFVGEFAQGLEIDRNPQFASWLSAQRRRFRAVHVAVLEQLVARLADDDANKSIEYLEKWLQVTPFDVRAHQTLLGTLLRCGRVQEAEEHLAATIRFFEAEGLEWLSIREAYKVARQRAPEPPSKAPEAVVDRKAPLAEPEQTPAHANPALIAREQVLSRLTGLWQQARSGRRQLVFVAGEPGIGKSTVIESFAAGLDPSFIARGQCVEQYGSGEPYLPMLEALNAMCQRDAKLVPLLRQVAPTWLMQLPWHIPESDRGALVREITGATHARMLREMGEWLERVATSRPLLLVFEDLQWSDTATVQLLEHVARRRSPGPLMIIGSFRPAELIINEHALGNLRRELRLHRLCEEIHLDGFILEQVDEYLELRLGAPVSDAELVHALHRHTDGLPLFLASVVDELIDQQIITISPAGANWKRAAAPERLPVPDSLSGVIEKQTLRLPGEVRRLLEAAAIAAVEFDHLAIADALELEPREVQERLDGLVRRGIWLRAAGLRELPDGRSSVRYAFRHALFRHVFANRVGAALCRELHRRIAQALEQSYGERVGEIAAELAMHFEHGSDPQRAVEYLVLAVENAQRGFALREALALVSRGLSLLPQTPLGPRQMESELRLRAAEGAMLVSLEGFASARVGAVYERAMSLCEQLPGNPAQVRVLHGLWWFYSSSGSFARARVLAERIHSLAEESGDASLHIVASNTLGMTLAHVGDMPLAQRHLERSLETYRTVGSDISPELFIVDPAIEALSYLSLPLWWRGLSGTRRARMHDLVELNARIVHPLSNTLALFMMSMQYERLRDPQTVQHLAEQSLKIIEEKDMLMGRASCFVTHGWALAAQGNYAAGIEELERGIAIQRSIGLLMGVTYFLYVLADTHANHGRHAAAATVADEAIALARQTGEGMQLSPLFRLRGEMRAAESRIAEAESDFREALRVAESQGALYYELAATLRLCRLPHIDVDAMRHRLEALLARFDPSDNTPEPLEARRWLADCGVNALAN